MIKLSLQQPLFATGWNAGLELQYLSSRSNYLGARIGGYTLVNLNLLNRKLAKDLEVAARLTNLLDKRFTDPASTAFDPLDRIVQDGREWSLRMEYRF
jgi:outer membrane receptor protein involved in Fe transport